jgi:Orsellinic acid/F9775 biosynthesis cluster protein D
MVISTCQVNSPLIAGHKLHFKPTEKTFHSHVMTTAEEYVIYNPQYKVLICREHGYAMKPSFIERHLRRIHKATPRSIRQSIIEYSNGLELIAPEDLETPRDTPAAIQGLDIKDSFQCINCSLLRERKRDIMDHCRHEHGWTKDQEDMWQGMKVQTFFQGTFIRYQTFKLF